MNPAQQEQNMGTIVKRHAHFTDRRCDNVPTKTKPARGAKSATKPDRNIPYPFNTGFVMERIDWQRKKTTKIARPMAVSAAAIAKTKITKI